MRRFIATLTVAALVFAWAIPAGASPFPDVPAYHWAYDAVRQLAAYGLVEGFPDGTFKGNEPLTRYQMAVVLARLLAKLDTQIKAEVAAVKTGGGAGVTSEEKTAVERIVEKQVEEITDEARHRLDNIDARLSAVAGAVEKLGARVDAIDKAAKATESKLADVKKAGQDADAKASSLQASLDELVPRVGELGKSLADLSAQVAEAKDAITESRDAITRADDMSSEALLKLDDLDARVGTLEAGVKDLQAKLEALEQEVAGEHVATAQKLSDIEGRQDEIEMTVEELGAKVQKLDERTGEARAFAEEKARELLGLLNALRDEFKKEIAEALEKAGVGKLTALEEQLAEVSSRIGDLEARSKRADERLEKLDVKSAELDARVTSLGEQFDIANERHDSMVKELGTKVDDIASQLGDVSSRMDAADAELASRLEGVSSELNKKIDTKASELDRKVDTTASALDAKIDEKTGAVDRKLTEHIAGHEKVTITGSSKVSFEDVDVEGAGTSTWKDPGDIFDDTPHGDGMYSPKSSFKHTLTLDFTAVPSEGVKVASGVVASNVFGTPAGMEAPAKYLSLDSLYLDVRTQGPLKRVYAGKLDPIGFTPFTLSADKMKKDQDGKDIEREGVIAEMAQEGFSATVLAMRDIKEGDVTPGDEEPPVSSLKYGFGVNTGVSISSYAALGASYLMWTNDTAVPNVPYKKQNVASLYGKYTLMPGWEIGGEYAQYVGGDGTAPDVEAAGMRLTMSGAVGSCKLTSRFDRVEAGFDAPFMNTDENSEDRVVPDLKEYRLGASLPLTALGGVLTVNGGYVASGDADPAGDWDEWRTGTASAGLEYKTGFFGNLVTVTGKLDAASKYYGLGDSGDIFKKESQDLAGSRVQSATAGVGLSIAPLTLTYDVTRADVSGGSAWDRGAYYDKRVLDLSVVHKLDEHVALFGGYRNTSVTDRQDRTFDDIEDTEETTAKAGVDVTMPLSSSLTARGGYEYLLTRDHIREADKARKSIVKGSIEAAMGPKAKLACGLMLASLYSDKTDASKEVSPVTNLTADLQYSYALTANTDLDLGYRYISSDARTDDPSNTTYDYIARIVTAGLKVRF